MERLRGHLGIDRWQVFGGSWGSALALAYAQTHPERVTELVLRGIFTLRRQELDWFYEGGASAVFPDLWEDFLAPVPAGRARPPHRGLRAPADRPDPAVHVPAAIAWSRWEASTITLLPQAETIARFTEPEYADGVRAHREPLLPPRRLVGRGAADPGCVAAARHPGGDRAGPLRHVHADR